MHNFSTHFSLCAERTHKHSVGSANTNCGFSKHMYLHFGTCWMPCFTSHFSGNFQFLLINFQVVFLLMAKAVAATVVIMVVLVFHLNLNSLWFAFPFVSVSCLLHLFYSPSSTQLDVISTSCKCALHAYANRLRQTHQKKSTHSNATE